MNLVRGNVSVRNIINNELVLSSVIHARNTCKIFDQLVLHQFVLLFSFFIFSHTSFYFRIIALSSPMLRYPR